MKKSFLIIISILLALGIVNTIAASIDEFSERPNQPDVIYPCYYYFDNQWAGEEHIRDCYGCLLKWVDNPRYASACQPF